MACSVSTSGGNLQRHVIHTVSPNFGFDLEENESRNSKLIWLELAISGAIDEASILKCESLTIPAISCGMN